MQRNSIFALHPLVASQRVIGSPSADIEATYGCVDWYQYQNSPPEPAESSGVVRSPAIAVPRSNFIERAAAAAGAAVTAATAATHAA